VKLEGYVKIMRGY